MDYAKNSFVLKTLLKLDYTMLSATERQTITEVTEFLDLFAELERKSKLEDEESEGDE